MVKAEKYIRLSQVAEGFLGASLQFEKGIEKTVMWYLFSKITPSLFTLKEGSTSHLGLLPSGKKRETALLGAIFAPPVFNLQPFQCPLPLTGDRNLP